MKLSMDKNTIIGAVGKYLYRLNLNDSVKLENINSHYDEITTY